MIWSLGAGKRRRDAAEATASQDNEDQATGDPATPVTPTTQTGPAKNVDYRRWCLRCSYKTYQESGQPKNLS
jgi:hypothetical protein